MQSRIAVLEYLPNGGSLVYTYKEGGAFTLEESRRTFPTIGMGRNYILDTFPEPIRLAAPWRTELYRYYESGIS